MMNTTVAALRMTAVAVVLGVVALTSTASPAAAQVLPADGVIYATADCYTDSNAAAVGVTVMNPSKFSASGLVYYVKVWAKGEWETNWTLAAQGPTGVVKTWSRTTWYPYSTTNAPTRIFNTTFTMNFNGNYDIYVQYWYKTPTATSWAATNGFVVGGDPHSQINVVVSDGFGTYSHNTGVCRV